MERDIQQLEVLERRAAERLDTLRAEAEQRRAMEKAQRQKDERDIEEAETIVQSYRQLLALHKGESLNKIGAKPTFLQRASASRNALKPTFPTPNTTGALVLNLLFNAGPRGITLEEIIAALEEQHLLQRSRNKSKTVDWYIYNLRQRGHQIDKDRQTQRFTLVNA